MTYIYHVLVNNAKLFYGFGLVSAAILSAIFLLRRHHASGIRMVFYVFSISYCISILIAWLAFQHGAIDVQGNYHGRAGHIVSYLLNAGLDLELELEIMLGALFALVAPQLMAYVLSGVFGCASRIYMLDKIFLALTWSIIKSLSTISGVLFAILSTPAFVEWSGFTHQSKIAVCFFSLIFLMFAFVIILAYRDFSEIAKWKMLKNVMSRVHNCFTRKCDRSPIAGRDRSDVISHSEHHLR